MTLVHRGGTTTVRRIGYRRYLLASGPAAGTIIERASRPFDRWIVVEGTPPRYYAGSSLRSLARACAEAPSDLVGADLAGADPLTAVRADLEAMLARVPRAVPALLAAVRAGRIDGTRYTSIGACACLIGTIARELRVEYWRIPGLAPDPGRPAERWFAVFRPGHTPGTVMHAALAAAWIEAWLARQPANGQGKGVSE